MILNDTLEKLSLPERTVDAIKTYVTSITEFMPAIKRIYLYGSQARGDWNEDSDIDVLLVFDKEYYNSFPHVHYLNEAIARAELKIQANGNDMVYMVSTFPVEQRGEVFSFEDYAEMPIMVSIKKEGILLYVR